MQSGIAGNSYNPVHDSIVDMKRNAPMSIMAMCVVGILISSAVVVINADAFVSEAGQTLYVGGTGPGNYTSIQEAVDAAAEGDIVYVYNGTYMETVRIPQSITLTGEDENGTVIDGNITGTVLEIAADSVTVKHVTIAGGGGDAGWDVPAVNITADHVVLQQCIIRDNEHTGISLVSASHCTVSYNVIVNTSYTGIRVGEASISTVISYNQITGGISGIYAYASGNQTISYNNVANCSKGIYLEESRGNLLLGNHLTGNQEGIFLSYAPGNTIQFNNFISNIRHARFVKLLRLGFLAPNMWSRNYWDDWMDVGGKVIFGAIYVPTFTLIGAFIPWIGVDWHPTAEPYDW